MARIRPLRQDEVSPHVGAIVEQAARAFGEPLVSSGIQAYFPPILEACRENRRGGRFHEE